MTITDFIEARRAELLAERAGLGTDAKCARQLAEAVHVIAAAHQLGGYCFPANEYGPDHAPYCASCGSGEPYEYPADWPCPTILALAAIWSDHPDYDPVWRPS